MDLRREALALTLTVAVALAAAGACDRPRLNAGADCSLNSDCSDPLVCRLERCRRQCVDSRDCGAGLLCLQIGATGGVCQLAEEATCSLTSECTNGLVCRFGTCTTECEEDRDCGPGALCQVDDESETPGCAEPSRELCIWDSDCPAPYVCGRDQQCQLECAEERDCPAPRVCVANLCQLPDASVP